MNESINYFLWISGAEHGPYTIELIRKAISEGTIDPQQTARTENSSEWKPLSQIARLSTQKPVKASTPSVKSHSTDSTPPPAKSTTTSTPKSSSSSSAVATGVVGAAMLSFLAWKLNTIERILDKKETKPQFEYMITSPKDSLFDLQMNALGMIGWEVVFARRATSSGEYDRTASYEIILKRQIR